MRAADTRFGRLPGSKPAPAFARRSSIRRADIHHPDHYAASVNSRIFARIPPVCDIGLIEYEGQRLSAKPDLRPARSPDDVRRGPFVFATEIKASMISTCLYCRKDDLPSEDRNGRAAGAGAKKKKRKFAWCTATQLKTQSGSFHKLSIWVEIEKDCFFAALPVFSRYRPYFSACRLGLRPMSL